ncbi:MAG: glycosyltransferase family 4 protein, partial [Candidatus Micrarchaeota archaeon]
MRLALATPLLEVKGGLERVIFKIAKRYDASIYCIRYSPENTFDEFRGLDVHIAPPSVLSRFPIGKRVIGAIEAADYFYNTRLENYDLVTAFQAPSEFIRNKNRPVIWYCNSPNREAFDLYEWRMKRRGAISKAIFWTSIQAFKHFEFKVVPEIEYIFANSINAQKKVKKYLNRESEVLYLAVDEEKFYCRDYERFFFYPSRLVPEKDFEYVIEAFKLFASKVPGWKLVLAGSLSERPEHQAYLKKLKSLCDASITIETNISEERLLDLYSRAYAVMYAAINEDFGLVPLEAMASSKPCIAKNEGGPKETISASVDGFLSDNPADMARKMEILVNDPELC